MKKFQAIIKVILEKKIVASILFILAYTTPEVAQWIGLNGDGLIESIRYILTGLGGISLLLASPPDLKKLAIFKKVKK